MPREPSAAVHGSRKFTKMYKKLDPNDERKKWIDKMLDDLKSNKYAGKRIGKSRIPEYYKNKYGVHNLYRYGHPRGYRSPYTIIEGCPTVLDFLSHDQYNRIFGYKRK